jgi:hypothetical protein
MHMANTVFINKDKHIGEIIIEGDQNHDTTQKMLEEVLEMNHQLSKTYGEVRALADVSRLGASDIGARTSATMGMNAASFDKFAVVGASAENERLINLIAGLAGKEAQVQFFANRAEAEAWLSE